MSLSKKERAERRENVRFRTMEDDDDLAIAMELVAKDLSEPYSIFTYRSFIQESPHLCLLAVAGRENAKSIDVKPGFKFIRGKASPDEDTPGEQIVGVCISRVAKHKKRSGEDGKKRGYIGMLAIQDDYRRMGLAYTMVSASIYSMVRVDHAYEIVLEVEAVNSSARRLYAGIGLTTDKLLPRYYLNGSDAYRMRLEIAAMTEPDDPAWDRDIRQVVPPGISTFWDGDMVCEVKAAAGRAAAATAAAQGKLTSNSFAGCLAAKQKRAHLGEQLRVRRTAKRVEQLEGISDSEWKTMVGKLMESAGASTATADQRGGAKAAGVASVEAAEAGLVGASEGMAERSADPGDEAAAGGGGGERYRSGKRYSY